MVQRGQDPKERALAETRSLNPRAEQVVDEVFASSEFFDAGDLVQVKYEMVRRARVDGRTVTASAAAFGFSRQSFYATEGTLAQEGVAGLVPDRPGPRGGHKLTDEVVGFAAGLLDADPSLPPADLADAIAERFGVRVHPRSVTRALERARRPQKEASDMRGVRGVD